MEERDATSSRTFDSARFRTRTGKWRSIPLNDATTDVLKHRKEESETEWVFTLNGLPIRRDTLTPKFKGYLRKLNMSEDLRFHSLRHTFASWLVQDGVSLYIVSKLLGHTSMDTTQIYAHLQPDMMHDVVTRLKLP